MSRRLWLVNCWRESSETKKDRNIRVIRSSEGGHSAYVVSTNETTLWPPLICVVNIHNLSFQVTYHILAVKDKFLLLSTIVMKRPKITMN